ncbi:MAG TPA: TIGR03619 family F420-dependent LLM class oxidoreductase [Acidimicrobiia bacterium]
MRYGITMFATDRTMPVWELAMEAEARGLDSVYLPEHTHIPVSRRTPPPTGDAELPEEYRRTVDPLVALAVAAARTDRIALGTGILLAAQREPIVTAKAIATLDAESGGRFVLGIGFGWNEDEIEHHRVDFKRRRDVCRDHVLAMRSLWRDDVAEYHGEFFELAPSWSWPKPARAGGPPVLIGGAAGPKLFAAIADYADGWIPIGGAGVRAALDDLRRACDARGRDVSELEIVPFGTLPEPGKLDYYEQIGISEVVARVRGGTRDEVLPILDKYRALLDERA